MMPEWLMNAHFATTGIGLAYIIVKLHGVKFDFLIQPWKWLRLHVWKNGKPKEEA